MYSLYFTLHKHDVNLYIQQHTQYNNSSRILNSQFSFWKVFLTFTRISSVRSHFDNDHCVSMNIVCDCILLRYCVLYDNNAKYKICNKMYFLRFILFRNTQGTCNCRKFMMLYKVLCINLRLVLVREVQVDGVGLNGDEMHLTCLLMTMCWYI